MLGELTPLSRTATPSSRVCVLEEAEPDADKDGLTPTGKDDEDTPTTTLADAALAKSQKLLDSLSCLGLTSPEVSPRGVSSKSESDPQCKQGSKEDCKDDQCAASDTDCPEPETESALIDDIPLWMPEWSGEQTPQSTESPTSLQSPSHLKGAETPLDIIMEVARLRKRVADLEERLNLNDTDKDTCISSSDTCASPMTSSASVPLGLSQIAGRSYSACAHGQCD